MFKKNQTCRGTVISVHTIYDAPWYISEIVIKPDEDSMLLRASFTESDSERVYKRGDTIPLIMGDFTWEIDKSQI